MSLILHIDTAVSAASICISKDGISLAIAENKYQKDHAEWLHPAIDGLLKENGIAINDLNAVAVSNGPGSYTGLRVGLASGKGFCFALSIPLITISTLEIMTIAAIESQLTNQLINQSTLFCPMIDARRMEVFTALYDKDLNIILAQQAKVIDEKSFEKELGANQIFFFGNGAKKSKTMITHNNALFGTVEHKASCMIAPAERKMNAKDFADLAYTEPFYIKDFHTVQPKK